MSSCIYLLHVSLIAVTLSPQPHGDGIAFANTLRTARSIPLAHPSHSATWLLPARAQLESLVVWPSRDVVPLGRVCSYLHTGLDFLSKERRQIKHWPSASSSASSCCTVGWPTGLRKGRSSSTAAVVRDRGVVCAGHGTA